MFESSEVREFTSISLRNFVSIENFCELAAERPFFFVDLISHVDLEALVSFVADVTPSDKIRMAWVVADLSTILTPVNI